MNKIKEFAASHIKISFFICVVFLSFVIYAQTVKFDFVYLDDNILIINKIQTLSDIKSVPSYFYKSVFSLGVDKYYRPALNLSFALDAVLGGLNPAAFHWTDILLHIFAVFLIFVFLLKFGFDKKLCFASGILFAVHPAFVQAVAWIPGRNDVLLAIFAVSSMIFIIDYLKYKKNVYLFFYAFAFLAALFTKETAVVLTMIIPLIILYVNRNFKNCAIKNICFLTLAALAVYFSFRYAALHNSRNSVSILGSLKYIFYSLPVILQYCDYIINPSRLSVIPAHINVDFFSFLSAFIIFVLPLVLSFIFGRGRKEVVLLGFLWFIFFFLPTLALPNNNYYSHRLYLPVAGIMIMWLECLSLIYSRKTGNPISCHSKEDGNPTSCHSRENGNPRLKNLFSHNTQRLIKKILLIVFFIIVALFVFASFFQAKKFQNRQIFWANALNDEPSSFFVLSNVGVYYFENKIYDEAEKYFLKAVFFMPSDYINYNNLGAIYISRGDAQTAKQYFERSVAINPDNDIALYNLSQLHLYLGDIETAYNLAAKATALEPNDAYYKELYDKVSKIYFQLQ